MSDPNATPPPAPDSTPAARSPGRVLSSPWVWMTLASALLGASGGVRAWQDYRFATVQDRVEAPPFPLNDLPKTLGEWRVVEGGEARLAPEVARVAGCSDHVIRTYNNATTGVSLVVLVLYGPAQNVFGHRPEVCYPSAGYQVVEEAIRRTIARGAGPPAEFRSAVFARQRDQQRGREEVYYSFRHGERWAPDMAQFWKDFRHHPSMFKVQVQRPVAASERRALENPTEQFLARLLPEIDRRVAHTPRGPEG
jgi:hypothetical protein